MPSLKNIINAECELLLSAGVQIELTQISTVEKCKWHPQQRGAEKV